MTEQTEKPEEMNPVDRSAELYQHEKEALGIAEIYDDIEFQNENPTSEDAMKTGRAEDIWEATVEESDRFAERHRDEIHEAALAEAARRIATEQTIAVDAELHAPDVYDEHTEGEHL